MTSYADGESKGERRPGLARFARRESLWSSATASLWLAARTGDAGHEDRSTMT